MKEIRKDLEQMKEEMERAYQETLRQNARNDAWFVNHMDPTSLVDWLAISARAGVPYIDTQIGGWVDRSTMLAVWEEDKEALKEMERQWKPVRHLADLLTSTGVGVVLRMDYASAGSVKYASGTSGIHEQAQWNLEEMPIYEDARIGELGFRYPREIIPVHVRPYIAPTMIEGFALEFRVWVKDAKVHAVSNYYPQRALDDTASIRRLIERATQLSQRLANGTPEDLVADCLALEGKEQNTERSFTADFLVPEGGGPLEMVFLEGNPYTFPSFGAHPCCFRNRLPELFGPTPENGPLIALEMTDPEEEEESRKESQGGTRTEESPR